MLYLSLLESKKNPVLVESYSWIAQNKENVYSNNESPYVQLNYSIIEMPTKIFIDSNQVNNYLITKKTFLENQSVKWKDYNQIFTDGSVINGKTGCAFYHKNKNVTKKYKLHNYASIYSAELCAIQEALMYCYDAIDNKKIVLFSDSKSSLLKLQNCMATAPDNYLISDILNLYCNLRQTNKHVTFVWIKAHIGIYENELVDEAAKEATRDGIDINFKIPHTDLTSVSKKRIQTNWQNAYIHANKGTRYNKNFSCLNKKPWYINEPNKNFVRIISRIRSYHALSPVHKKIISLQNDENCECERETRSIVFWSVP